MHESLWFTTRSALFQPGEQGWAEVARYEQPLRRLLARRYARGLSEADRDDLLQEVLIEIRETLAQRFEPSRGKFRALLQAVVARRVVDRLRKARPQALAPGQEQTLTAPSAEDWEDLDLEAALVQAVGACRDHFSGGPTKDLDVLHTLVDRLVRGQSTVEIARRDGVSRDRVGRLLTKGREQIFRHLLADQLELALDDPGLAPTLNAFKRMLRKPTQAQAALDELDPAAAERLDAFWGRFRAALPRFAGDTTAAGRELEHGVHLILGEPVRDDAG